MTSSHLSDCSAYDTGACDCGGLDLAIDTAHGLVPVFIASTGCFGVFIQYVGGECFVEPEYLPADRLIALAAASDLIGPHDVMPGGAFADGVDLNDAREAVIAKLKALAVTQGLTGEIIEHGQLLEDSQQV